MLVTFLVHMVQPHGSWIPSSKAYINTERHKGYYYTTNTAFCMLLSCTTIHFQSKKLTCFLLNRALLTFGARGQQFDLSP